MKALQCLKTWQTTHAMQHAGIILFICIQISAVHIWRVSASSWNEQNTTLSTLPINGKFMPERYDVNVG